LFHLVGILGKASSRSSWWYCGFVFWVLDRCLGWQY